jgi:DNA-binding NarL/FixJ family response regulator
MIRLVLVDDHPLVREGIRGMVAAYPDIEVVGQAADGGRGLDIVRELRPDLVLMDLRMPGGDGVTATREIVSAGLSRVVVLTTYETDEDILRAVEAGATGYLLKDITPDELARAVRAAARGETVLAPSAQGALLHRVQRPRAATPALSAREVAVLAHAAEGRTNAAIGAAMHISETTVKTYLARAFDKLGVSDRTSAVRRAIDRGLIR